MEEDGASKQGQTAVGANTEMEINRIRHQVKNKCTSIMYLNCTNSVPNILKYIL